MSKNKFDGQAIAEFFRVRKILFTNTLMLALSVSTAIFVGIVFSNAWIILPILASAGFIAGSIYGIYVMCAQLHVQKSIYTPKELSYKKGLKELRKKRLEACLKYYSDETGNYEKEQVGERIKRIDKEIADWTGEAVLR